MFLSTNLLQVIDVDIEEVWYMFPIEDLQQHMINAYWILTLDFVMWNAPTEEICVLAMELQYIFTETNRDLYLDPT
jgi:hypothetical protein